MNLLTLFLFCIIQLLAINSGEKIDSYFFESNECVSESSADAESRNNLNDDSVTYNCSSINEDLKNCSCANDFIDCSNRNLYSMPVNLKNLPNSINRLLFANNFITNLQKLTLNNETSIKVIDLRKNKINKISIDFFSSISTSLEYLYLCDNVDLNDIFSINNTQFNELKFIQLNQIQNGLFVKDGFFTKEKFPLLTNLELNNAGLKFDKLPFDRLDELTTLRLDSNQLNELPCESFKSLTSLETLNLNNNSLDKPNKIGKNCLNNLQNLTTLSMRSNSLKEENLNGIYFSELKSLQRLLINGNKFSKIPYDYLKDLQMLNVLRISINQERFASPSINLVKLNSVLWPKLVNLDLTNSNISFLPKNSFSRISTELNDLILKNSAIKNIEKDAFADLKNLIFVNLKEKNLFE